MPAGKQGNPKLWRVQGKASDGLVVTLGRFETEEQAKAEAERLVADAAYRDIVVQAIVPAPRPESADGPATPASPPGRAAPPHGQR